MRPGAYRALALAFIKSSIARRPSDTLACTLTQSQRNLETDSLWPCGARHEGWRKEVCPPANSHSQLPTCCRRRGHMPAKQQTVQEVVSTLFPVACRAAWLSTQTPASASAAF